MIEFFALDDDDGVLFNCYYLNFDGLGILLDCGVNPKCKNNSIPSFEKLSDKPIHAVIISHSHRDHISSLPYLVKKFPFVKIYMTSQSVDIAKVTLHNALRIMEMESDDRDQLYSHEEIDYLLRTVFTKDYEEKFEIVSENNKKIEIEFYDAGHILGSAAIFINYNGYRIFYTGDIRISPQYILNGASFPKGKVDLLISEATYGATDTNSVGKLGENEERFIRELNNVINKGGSILIPVFALGKNQEFLTMLHKNVLKGRIPNTPIYTAGISRKISKIYDDNRYLIDRDYKELKINSDIPQNNIYEIRNPNIFNKEPAIVLAPSGMMLNNTLSHQLAKHWINKENFAIFIIGYIDNESPGYIFTKAEKNDYIVFDGNKYKVKCDIKKFKFSSHAYREELIEMIEDLFPREVILTHGDDEALNWMIENIHDLGLGIQVATVQSLNNYKFN